MIFFNTNQEDEIVPEMRQPTEIESLYTNIEETKKQNDESNNPYIPKSPEWNNSAGPIVIDRYEYILGQKVFVNISEIGVNDKGRINVYKIVENEDYSILYSSIGFDGSQTRNNYYFTPSLTPMRGICNVDDLTGVWVMSIEGTEYPDLFFTVIEEYMPGYESNFEPITNIGQC